MLSEQKPAFGIDLVHAAHNMTRRLVFVSRPHLLLFVCDICNLRRRRALDRGHTKSSHLWTGLRARSSSSCQSLRRLRLVSRARVCGASLTTDRPTGQPASKLDRQQQRRRPRPHGRPRAEELSLLLCCGPVLWPRVDAVHRRHEWQADEPGWRRSAAESHARETHKTGAAEELQLALWHRVVTSQTSILN